jgi:hypothetical protein
VRLFVEADYNLWLDTYRPLYGDHATPALFREQHAFAAAVASGEGTHAYERMIGRAARHALGEYFTPPALVEFVLDRAGYSGQGTLLDPAAGLGAFVAAAQARGGTAAGFELNPLTASAAIAQGLPVEIRDTLVRPGNRRFDFVVGNPPWINWRYLNPCCRQRTAPLWEHYGLLPRGGLRARLGASMDDLSILFTYLCADRLLASGGKLAFLLSRALFQSAGGGQAFRRFELPNGRHLRVIAVHEIEGAGHFANATANAVAAVFEVADAPTIYPVNYFRGSQKLLAQPVSEDPASSWAIVRSTTEFDRLRGSSPYAARVGAHSGGAGGVYWVDVLEQNEAKSLVRNRARAGRREWPEVVAEVESCLVHPLVRGRDVGRWRAQPSCSIILPHTPDGRPIAFEQMRRDYPLAFAYFERFREDMLVRPHYLQHFERSGQPHWSMYNVGAYTFSPHRVVWREQCRTLECAVIENAGHIADAKLTLVACDSADESRYLAAMLNSKPAREFVESYSLRTQISTHVLRHLYVPKFDPADHRHAALAEIARAPDEDRLEALARQVWGLTA